MDRKEKVARLTSMLKMVAPDNELESLAQSREFSGTESMSSPRGETELVAQSGLEKIAQNDAEDLSDAELMGLEAIVLPRERPVIFVRNNSFAALPAPWSHYSEPAPRKKIEAAIPSIGRVELPNAPWIPYGGTGFIVGPNLLMTNRHVAELFASGLGLRGLNFRAGQTSAVNFRREKGLPESDQSIYAEVKQVVMIHPFWDMALLRVEGLPATVKPLTLSILEPDALVDREIAVLGYPARDDRNDLELQDRIFERTYNVKRLHPGKIRPRQTIRSFANQVNALTHDSSTLGGNSGSAVLDVKTGEILGLHFAGIYLKANYAVPAYELARDSRVVDAGVKFAGSLPASGEIGRVWRAADPEETQASPVQRPASPTALQLPVSTQQTSITIPLNITVTLGSAMTVGGIVAQNGDASTLTSVETEAARLRQPILHPGIETRRGFTRTFLDLDDGEEVPLPELTSSGQEIVAVLDGDEHELKYHKFSIVMHKERRLALVTAANVDWRDASRRVDGRRPTRKELTGIADGFAEEWYTDPRIPETQQLPDTFFTEDRGSFDKGHLVRRDDVCWGSSFDDIQKGNGDTYHTTNCSPQISGFNQAAKGEDNWGDLEDLVQRQTGAELACVFSGPILADDDPIFAGKDKRGPVRIAIPRSYWKIIVTKGEDGPEAFGFVIEQDLTRVDTEFAVPSRWKRFMRKIADIESLTGNLFKLKWFKRHDQFAAVNRRRADESSARAMAVD